MIVESLYSHLTDDAGVSAITARMYPQTLPQEVTLPAISYFMAADNREPLIDGEMSPLKEALFDLNAWAETYTEAHQLAEAIEAALVGTVGAFGSASPADNVDTIRMERKFDLFETDTKRYRVTMRFFVAYY